MSSLSLGATMKKETKKELLSYLIIIIIIILIRSFIITPVRVNGTSMDTTLKNGEIMILNKIKYRFKDIKRFDIVVVNYNGEKLIKRVIGMPGETLKYVNSKLYINNEEVEEYFKNQDTEDFDIKELNYDTIPDNCYMVLGDNRKDSLDSRFFGCIDRKDILGNANLVLFPFNKFGIKK